MNTTTDKLIQFFEQVKTLTFWQRLFSWSRFRSLSYEAYEEFKALLSEAIRHTQELDASRTDTSVLRNDNDHLKSSLSTLENEVKTLRDRVAASTDRVSEISSLLATKEEALRQSEDKLKEHELEIKSLKEKGAETFGKLQELTGQLATRDEAHRQNQEKLLRQEYEINGMKEKLSKDSDRLSELSSSLAGNEEAVRQAGSRAKGLEIELAASKEKNNGLTQELSQLRQQNTIFKQTEDDRKTQYDKNVASLNAIRDQIQADRSQEISKQQQAEIDRINGMKQTWARHQEDVKSAIKMICDRHTIEYVENVPFKGNPDNTIKICDEFVIFDAKAPASDDLNNFPTYIKSQTESVKKYAKEENVRKEIFLVIPANTLDVITLFSYNLADYHVYVITLDSLEPIILSLKRLEEYEFVEQLSPEERENICRVIGKFAHLTKRRIQIDQFFERQFLEMLSKCETDLPPEVLEKVIEYERSEKLNPPVEKRAKLISSRVLEIDSEKIRKEAEAKAIAFPASVQEDIRSLPLYRDESPNDGKV